MLTVGQKLIYISNHTLRYNALPQPHEVEVVKVGRLYATLNGIWGRINLKTLEVHGEGYSSPGRCYLSLEHYHARRRALVAWRALLRRLNGDPGRGSDRRARP